MPSMRAVPGFLEDYSAAAGSAYLARAPKYAFDVKRRRERALSLILKKNL